MSKAPQLDQSTLKGLLTYSPVTGDFRWKKRKNEKAWNTKYAGKVAGYDWRAGPNVVYRSIRIFNFPFLGHRLAFLYMTGDWPSLVDHKDGNGLNNKWDNLRIATRSQNSANAGASKRNKTGFRGVAQERGGKFRANIFLDGRQTYLGAFDTAEEASEAYQAALKQKSGDFARAA